MSGDLAAFLRARLDEDEHGAQFVKERESGVEVPVTNWLGSPFADRVLREVEAKRRILQKHERCSCPEVRWLAAIYSDHPDYPV